MPALTVAESSKGCILNFMKLCDFTPAAMLDELEMMRAHRPEIETLTYILGRDRILEWAHSVGVAT